MERSQHCWFIFAISSIMELHSVDFKTILAWLKDKNRRIKVETLGGNSHLYCEHVNDGKMLIIGSTGQYKIIGVRFWKSVCRRMDSLSAEERQMAGKYADTTEWNNPDYRFAPSVPAICKAYLLDTKNNKQ